MNKFSANNKNKGAQIEAEETIDLRELFFNFFRHWKWFVLSIILSLSLGILVYLMMDRKYEVVTAVLLKEDKGSSSGGGMKDSPLSGLQSLGLLSTTNNIDNEIAVFTSPNLMRQTVLALELEASYFESGLFRDKEVYRNSPYYAKLESVMPTDLDGSIELLLKSKGDAGVSVTGVYSSGRDREEYDIKGELDKLPGTIVLPRDLGTLYIAYRPNVDKEKRNKNYKVYIDNAQEVAYNIVDLLAVTSTTKSSSVLTFNLQTLNVGKAVDILEKVTEIYNKNNIEENNETALNTARFIDARLIDITKELEEVEDDVVEYKKKERITDIGSEAKIFVEQTSFIEQKRIEIITQLKTIELLDDFLNDPKNDYRLVPTLGITDVGLVGIISEYNMLLIDYERLERSAHENSPARVRALAEIESIRSSIKGSINNIQMSMGISKSELDKQMAGISSRISSVPAQERGLLEVMRQQQIKQALYLYLLQVREETNISLASNSAKAKVITDPIIPKAPMSPNRNVILLMFLLAGFIIPCVIIFLRDKMRVNISNREELEQMSDVNVIGEIMKSDGNEGVIVVRPNTTTAIVELFRSLRNNVKFILNGSSDNKVILVTSTIPGEGKTFVSVNLATSFALSDKKVLLLGMDVRNPKLAADMNFRKGMGLTSYLLDDSQDWKSFLTTLKDYPNMSILQAGVVPPNPNELLMKPALKQLIDEAKELYDIIIIDSAPVGVISDTFIIAPLADMTVYVTRENITPRNAVGFINDMNADDKLPNMCLVLNGVDLSKKKGSSGRYGYGKTYGYGVAQ